LGLFKLLFLGRCFQVFHWVLAFAGITKRNDNNVEECGDDGEAVIRLYKETEEWSGMENLFCVTNII